MHYLFLPAVMSLIGCASVKKPVTPNPPKYMYMALYGKFRAYPVANILDQEKDVTSASLVGAMCLELDDFEAKEKYIMELEAYSGVR